MGMTTPGVNAKGVYTYFPLCQNKHFQKDTPLDEEVQLLAPLQEEFIPKILHSYLEKYVSSFNI